MHVIQQPRLLYPAAARGLQSPARPPDCALAGFSLRQKSVWTRARTPHAARTHAKHCALHAHALMQHTPGHRASNRWRLQSRTG
eukprot:7042223-Alexandrium_andersonii.AAC.1